MEIRNAVKGDAGDLAYLINLAGEGIPEYLWSATAGANESPLEVGARRAAREEGSFSYTNARVCVDSGVVLGMILSYRLPDLYEIGDLSDCPDVVRPLIVLESQVPGSWYINGLATYEKYRGRGVARRLSEDAEARARSCGCGLLSLIVASGNAPARRLYGHMGFKDVAAMPIVPYPGYPAGGRWVLMTKHIDNVSPAVKADADRRHG